MTKRPKRRPRRKHRDSASAIAETSPHTQSEGRNASLDTLRGIAIVLMVIDHATWIWFGLGIAETPIRFATRLSMPLFCVLMGYFFRPKTTPNFRRLGQISLACLIANLVFWPYCGRIEILSILLVCYLLFIATRQFFVIFVLSILLYPLDSSTVLLDFPISIVLSFVAQGVVLGRFGILPALATGLLLASGAYWIHELEPNRVNHLLCYFIIPATLLVCLGGAKPNLKIPGLTLIGRYPLSSYVLHYYLVMAVYFFFLR